MLFKKINYGEVLESSFVLLKKNIILFLPNLLMVLLSFLLISVFFYGSGISNLLFTKPYILEDTAALINAFDKLSRTAPFIITLFIWIAGELIFGAFFAVMKFGMIRDVVNNKKTSLKSGLKFAEKNYFNYWIIHLASFFLIFLPLFILLFVYLLFVGSVENIILSSFILGIFAIVWLCYAVLMAIRLFFVFPVMTFEKERYFQSIKHEFHYVKTHMGHTFISFMIVLAFLVGYHIIKESIEFFGIRFYGAYLIIVIAILMALFEVFVSTWEHVFIFKSYLVGKHINELVEKAKKSGNYIPPRSTKNKVSKKKPASNKKGKSK